MMNTKEVTQVVLVEIRSKVDGPGIDGGSGAYVHIFFQQNDTNWREEIHEFIDYYGYELVSIEDGPNLYIDSSNWSDFNRKQAIDATNTGFPRFGTFQVFD